MKVREIVQGAVRVALYLSPEEARELRDELGEVPRRILGETAFELYQALHVELMQHGIGNELPEFEEMLVEERETERESLKMNGKSQKKRGYNSRGARRKAGTSP